MRVGSISEACVAPANRLSRLMIAITLRQLHYFDALARLGHFGRAAEACAVTQPALSMQIQELEGQLGAVLFERGRKGVSLTAEGRAIAPKAAQILIDAQDLIDQARHGGRLMSGSLRLGVIPTVAPYLLPTLLPILRASYPVLELQVRETQTAALLAELGDGRLDAVIVALPLDAPEFEIQPLLEDKFLLAAPRGFRASGEVLVDLEHLRLERVLLLEEGHCFREQALNYCRLLPSGAMTALGASSFATIVRMVANGMGVTLLPELAARAETRGDEIELLRLPAPEPRRILALVWRKTSPRKQDFTELAAIIRGLDGVCAV